MSRSTRRSTESGAVATIIAVMLAAGVLLGFLALSVDVGGTILERRELQNGADAGALALAQSCIEDPNCATSEDIQGLVNANARDGEHQILRICGVGPGLTPCDSDQDVLEDIRKCPPLPAGFASLPYAQIHTQTLRGADDFIQNPFGGTLQGGTSQTTVDTCARAVWGSPGTTGTTFPMTISICGWNTATGNGSSFPPKPPYNPAPAIPPASATNAVPDAVKPFVTYLFAHVKGNPSDECGPTMDVPGNFGWLDDGPESQCRAQFDSNGGASGDPGADPTQGCKQGGMEKWLGEEVLIPVFTDVDDSGQKSQYTFAGVSSFFFAGWRDVPAGGPKDYEIYTDSGLDLCQIVDSGGNSGGGNSGGGNSGGGNSGACIWGWFTSPLVAVGTIDPSVPSRGPVTVQMAG